VIRLLIIGGDADWWRDELTGWTGESFEVDTEARPAAGIRNFSETSPDAVAVAEPDGSGNIVPVVEAIRERPLGQVVPIMVLGPSRLEDERLEVAAVVGKPAGGGELIRRLEASLDVEIAEEPRHAQSTSDPDIEVDRSDREDDEPTHVSTEIPTVQSGHAEPSEASPRGGRPASREAREQEAGGEAVEHRDYVIEPLDEDGGITGKEGADRASSSGSHEAISTPDTAEIRRKLKEVRHEDYFVILDVSRSVGVEGVREAYRAMKARYRADNLDIHLAEKFESELDEINDALDDARAVLGDENLREAYLDRTTRG
jgi:hypothetical protein